jgi:hypothetical protein
MLKPFDFVYTHAIVCRVANSFKDGSFKGKEIKLDNAINIAKAKEQHNEYISTLRYTLYVFYDFRIKKFLFLKKVRFRCY